MLDLPANMEEREIYPLVPQKDRWIFNKLTIAERQGHRCGVSGVPLTVPGVYCIRSIYNLAGNGDGGVLRWVFDGTNQPPMIPGWFWCEWFEGYHEWVEFTDDVPVAWHGGTRAGRRLVLEFPPAPTNTFFPPQLQGISKHMLVEYIDGNIIEVAPRHAHFIHPRGEADLYAMKWNDPYFGHETFYWKVVRKDDPEPGNQPRQS